MYLVELKIDTFRGSIGAEHWYAKFCVHNDKEHDMENESLERPVDKKEADYLNKKDGNDPDFYWIKEGDLVNRFNSVDEIFERAKLVFVGLFDANSILFYNQMKKIDHPIYGEFWDDDYVILYGTKDLLEHATTFSYIAKKILKQCLGDGIG